MALRSNDSWVLRVMLGIGAVAAVGGLWLAGRDYGTPSLDGAEITKRDSVSLEMVTPTQALSKGDDRRRGQEVALPRSSALSASERPTSVVNNMVVQQLQSTTQPSESNNKPETQEPAEGTGMAAGPELPSKSAWPGAARGASIYGRPTGAICEDGLRRGVTFDMNAVEPIPTLADGRALPPGTKLRVRVGDVRLGNGDDPSIARFELAAVEWNGQWQPVTAAAYRVPFERRRSVGASALKGAAIGAAAGTIVSLVFKTDLAPSLLIGAAAGAAIGASTAGASQLSCIDPAQTKLGFEF